MLFEVLLSAGFAEDCCDWDDDGEEIDTTLAGDLVALVELAIGGFEFDFELPTVFIGDELLLLLFLLILLPLLADDCDMAEAFEGATRFGEGFGEESGVDLGVDFGDLRLTRRLIPGEGLAEGELAPRYMAEPVPLAKSTREPWMDGGAEPGRDGILSVCFTV